MKVKEFGKLFSKAHANAQLLFYVFLFLVFLMRTCEFLNSLNTIPKRFLKHKYNVYNVSHDVEVFEDADGLNICTSL